MRIVRFIDSVGQIHYGADNCDGTAMRIQGDILGGHTVTHQKIPIQKLLAPICPVAIFCIGLNYRRHAAETGAKIPSHPVLFMKNPASVQNPGDPIELPVHLPSTSVDIEGELASIIGRRAKNVSKADALSYCLGFTAANDVSARDWQKQFGGGQWCRGKTFDTFCPLGPAIVTLDEIGDPNNLALTSAIDGNTMQSSNTADMIFAVQDIVEFLSGSTTLLPGSVILTGTPEGVGMARTPPIYLKPGDRVTVTIERIGELANPVILENLSAARVK